MRKFLLILLFLLGSLALPHAVQAQGSGASAAEEETADDDTDKLFEQVFGKRQTGGAPALEVPLVVDGVDRGSINIEPADDPFDTKMDYEAFTDQVVDFLTDEAADQLLAIPAEDGKIKAGDLFDLGIMAEFDSFDLVMQIEIDPELRKPLPLNLTNRGRAPRSLTDPLGPAPLSAYVNIRSGLDHVHETTGDSETGTNPVRVDFAGALALPKAAFDYRFSYNENSSRPWQRGDLRVLRDVPESALRWTYGDLSFPTTNFQSFTPMGGITVARNYALQPYVVTEPVASNEFVARLGYRIRGIRGVQNRNFDLSLLYTGQRFGALGSTQPNSNSALDAAVRYSQRLPMNLSGSLGGTYKLARNSARNSGSVSGSLSRQLARGTNLSLDLQRRRDTEGAYENRAFVSLNISLVGRNQNITATRDSETGVSRLDWNYRPERVIGGVAATAGIQRDSGDSRLTGELSRTGYRAETSISHDVSVPRSNLTEAERVTSARIGTAVVFAGGHVALSRPITDGFAIIVPHPSLKGQTIGINPRGERAYVAEADAFGPAVIPDLTSYQVRRVLVDVPDLAIGAELGQDVFDVIPTVRSGTAINIGTSASVLATFKVVDDAGEPIALQAGEIRQIGNDSFEPLLVFSDRSGLMTSDGLTPGSYELILFAFPDLPVTFDIADDAIGIVDLGTFRVAVTGPAPEPSDAEPAIEPPKAPDADDLAPVREADAGESDAPATEEVEVARRPDTGEESPTSVEPTPETQTQTEAEGASPAAPRATAGTTGLPRELATAPQNFGQYRVQLAAFRSPRDAEAAWKIVQPRHSDALGSLGAVVVEVDLGARGVFYRLQVGPLPDQIAARQLCRTLQERGQSCLVVAPAGAPPAEQPPRNGRDRADLPATDGETAGPRVPAVPVAPVETTRTTPADALPENEPTSHLVQLASLQTEAAAEAEWQRLKEQYPRLLGRLDLVVVPIDLGPTRGVFHRVQAGPLVDAQAARSVCTALRQEGQACLEVAPSADAAGSVAPQLQRAAPPAPATAPPALRTEDRVPAPIDPVRSSDGEPAVVGLRAGQPNTTLVISSSGSQLQPAEAAPTTSPADRTDTTESLPAPPVYRLRLATARLEGDATAELRRLREDLGDVLSPLETGVTAIRDGAASGISYQVEAGAFTVREDALAACRPIQSAGRPCLVVEARAQTNPPEGTGPLSLLRSTK